MVLCVVGGASAGRVAQLRMVRAKMMATITRTAQRSGKEISFFIMLAYLWVSIIIIQLLLAKLKYLPASERRLPGTQGSFTPHTHTTDADLFSS
ncbi:hypothetical protein EJP617_32550 [Erwinia sp. Ejp617]|nr:hypothetical protein [Erwinia sp. Ejp617]ADP12936.1 hypothetical protein EJP617_32550 [Erwinia sp. Ejp617]